MGETRVPNSINLLAKERLRQRFGHSLSKVVQVQLHFSLAVMRGGLGHVRNVCSTNCHHLP